MAERARAVAKRDFYEKDTFFITVPVISNIMLIMISSYIQAIKKGLPINRKSFLPQVGIEPTTYGFSVRRSTN